MRHRPIYQELHVTVTEIEAARDYARGLLAAFASTGGDVVAVLRRQIVDADALAGTIMAGRLALAAQAGEGPRS